MKNKRHAKILEIIENTNTVTQSDLTEKLKAEGFDVTQATVSRDIKELGLVKVASGSGGYKYQLPYDASAFSSKHITIFSHSVMKIDCALHTIVVKTLAGMANAAAAAVDNLIGDKILGSIAGDDTVLIVTRSEQEAKELTEVLTNMQSGEV